MTRFIFILCLWIINLVAMPSSAWIINGERAKSHDVKTGALLNSLVKIEIFSIDAKTQNKGVSFCTGTLIAPDIVLTAAHCFFHDNKIVSAVTVSFQSLRVFGGSKTMTSQKFKINADYEHQALLFGSAKGPSHHDYAVIQLPSPAPDWVQPIGLADGDVSKWNTPTLKLFAAGYGQTKNKHNEVADPGTLHWTEEKDGFQIEPTEEPLSGAQWEKTLIKVNTTNSGTCFGDSGGPLLAYDSENHQLLQVGISSSVLPGVTGQQWNDYRSMSREDYFKKYPDAPMCSGLSFYANIGVLLSLIQADIAELRAQP